MKILLVVLAFLGFTQAFVASRPKPCGTMLHMAPRFDKAERKWYPTKPDEGPQVGYPPIRSLLRHGPKSFIARVFTPDQYEQAVLKFMAGEKCNRDEAQGNMDAVRCSRQRSRSRYARSAISLTLVNHPYFRQSVPGKCTGLGAYAFRVRKEGHET